MIRSLAVGAGAVLLAGGAAVAGTAAQGSAPAAAPAAAPQAQISDAALASAVTADEGTPPGDAPAAAAKLPRRSLCARVPKAITRTQALEKKLAADASTKGSLAWLKAKVDAAEAAHRTEVAEALRNRLTFRTELAQFLPQRLELLQTASRTICATPASS